MVFSPSLKILHVAETIRGGIATYMNEVHPYHAKEYGSSQIRYVVPEDHREDLKGIDSANVIGFTRTGRDLASLWRMAKAACAATREMQPDVVHLHSTFAGMVLRPVLKTLFPNTRLVYCPHGWAFLREASALSHFTTKTVERLLAPLSSRIVCISRYEFEAAVAAGIAPDKLALVHNGISAERPARQATTWDDPRKKVLFVGRLDRQKGYDLLLEAARRLENDIHVRMIGSTVLEKSRPLDLPSNVEIHGWQSRSAIEAQLDQADLAVIPSRWEGFGFVALEAMRARKAVVAFAVGALPEIIEDGVTGILCSPVNADALAEALTRALRAPLAAMGEAGHDRFQRQFIVETMQSKLCRVYSEITQQEMPGEKQQLPSAE